MNPTYGKYDPATNKMHVYLNEKYVGDIRAHAWGWHYVPKGGIDAAVRLLEEWDSDGLLK